jgi:hypothetical protein
MARVQVVGTRRQPGRCAYCRDSLDALVHRCEGCSTWLHIDCLEELGRCPTPGCAGQPASAPSPAQPTFRAPRGGRAGRRERRERRRRHRQRRREPSRQTLQAWAEEEAVEHHRAPTGWARAAPYVRLAMSGVFNLLMVSAILFTVAYALMHPTAAWEALKSGKHGKSVLNGVMSLAIFGGGGLFGLFVGIRWLMRWPTVWDEVGELLDHSSPVPMRLRVWTEGSGKHKKTWASLRPVSDARVRETRFKLDGLLPASWLRRPRGGTPVLVYGIEDGEPPFLIENGAGQLAIVHPD